MPFFVAVKSDPEPSRWRLLYRSETLAVALDAYRAVSVRAGECKVLAEWGGGGWQVLAHTEGVPAETPTDQSRADRTDQAQQHDEDEGRGKTP
jgi:hypothetical protein